MPRNKYELFLVLWCWLLDDCMKCKSVSFGVFGMMRCGKRQEKHKYLSWQENRFTIQDSKFKCKGSIHIPRSLKCKITHQTCRENIIIMPHTDWEKQAVGNPFLNLWSFIVHYSKRFHEQTNCKCKRLTTWGQSDCIPVTTEWCIYREC
jgi:hypothetical protein